MYKLRGLSAIRVSRYYSTAVSSEKSRKALPLEPAMSSIRDGPCFLGYSCEASKDALGEDYGLYEKIRRAVSCMLFAIYADFIHHTVDSKTRSAICYLGDIQYFFEYF